MSNQIKIVPKIKRLIHFIESMEKGELKIPSFQRDFIWTKKQREELFESIKLEYPIGAILLWQPEKEFKINHQLGPITVNKTSQSFFYILDGFQRLSTLYGCLINPLKTENEIDGAIKNEFALYYDLENEEFNIPRSESIEIANIPVHILIDTFGYLDFSENLRDHYDDRDYANLLIGRGRKLSSTLIDYNIPYVEIYGGDIEQAVNIFSRINSKGSPISKDWMVSALTTDESLDFNLGELIEELLDDLEKFDFQNLKRDVILQCIQNSFGKIYFDLKIEDLIKRKDFIEKAIQTIKSIKKAVQFLYENLYVLSRRLLPYNNQLIFISYFFNEVDKNSDDYAVKMEELKKWFWITTYANYFTIYSLSKIRKSFEHFKEFVAGKNLNSVYNDNPEIPFVVADFPDKVNFGSVRSTSLVLFMLNYAYDFKKNNAQEIDGINLDYLLFGDKSPENLVPTIKYSSGKENEFLPVGKHKDLSFLLQPQYFKPFLEKLFLDRGMEGVPAEEILATRQDLIIGAEYEFVSEKLGLAYY